MDEFDLADLYERHRRGLFALAMSVTRCPARAEDAVHDAFVRLCRGASVRGDSVAYVFSAVRNSAIDQLRRRPVHEGNGELSPSLFDQSRLDPHRLAMDAERDRSIARAIDRLPPEQREVVVLRIFAGLRFAQIAEVLSTPLPTVATRYRRALESLKVHLENVV